MYKCVKPCRANGQFDQKGVTVLKRRYEVSECSRNEQISKRNLTGARVG